jgi:hypothetical protein
MPLGQHIGIEHQQEIPVQVGQGVIEIACLGMATIRSAEIAAAQAPAQVGQFRPGCIVGQPHGDPGVLQGQITPQGALQHLQRFNAARHNHIDPGKPPRLAADLVFQPLGGLVHLLGDRRLPEPGQPQLQHSVAHQDHLGGQQQQAQGGGLGAHEVEGAGGAPQQIAATQQHDEHDRAAADAGAVGGVGPAAQHPGPEHNQQGGQPGRTQGHRPDSATAAPHLEPSRCLRRRTSSSAQAKGKQEAGKGRAQGGDGGADGSIRAERWWGQPLDALFFMVAPRPHPPAPPPCRTNSP